MTLRPMRLLDRARTPRGAVQAIAAVTLLITLVAGTLIHLVDRSEFPTIGSGMWWAVQTVTSVGYGDAVPSETAGRIVAVYVMLTGIAFLTVATAAISAAFLRGSLRRSGPRAMVRPADAPQRRGPAAPSHPTPRPGRCTARGRSSWTTTSSWTARGAAR
jgi:voltage-gated potassium channel